MACVRLPGGESFRAEPGENLLSAAQRAHWLVRHGCRNGNCGVCSATLLSGALSRNSGRVTSWLRAAATSNSLIAQWRGLVQNG